MPDAPVLLAGRYRLGESLGRGGMGQVLLARDETLERDVAIKELDQPLGSDGAASARRTIREARAAARINHPNVVQVYDVLQLDDRTWIVMEYVSCRSLREEIAEQGPLDPYRVARIGLDLLGALRTAHRLGVEHRDVKPANVLLADDGRVLLTDFGIAAVDDDAVISRSDILVGSPQFMAPERARNGVSGPEADLWSLGATLYAAIEGRAPYQRGSTMATLTALTTEEPDPPKHSGVLRPLLDGLLRKDPVARMSAEDAEGLARSILTGLDEGGDPNPPKPVGGLAGFAAAFRIPRPRPAGPKSGSTTGSGSGDASRSGSKGKPGKAAAVKPGRAAVPVQPEEAVAGKPTQADADESAEAVAGAVAGTKAAGDSGDAGSAMAEDRGSASGGSESVAGSVDASGHADADASGAVDDQLDVDDSSGDVAEIGGAGAADPTDNRGTTGSPDAASGKAGVAGSPDAASGEAEEAGNPEAARVKAEAAVVSDVVTGKADVDEASDIASGKAAATGDSDVASGKAAVTGDSEIASGRAAVTGDSDIASGKAAAARGAESAGKSGSAGGIGGTGGTGGAGSGGAAAAGDGSRTAGAATRIDVEAARDGRPVALGLGVVPESPRRGAEKRRGRPQRAVLMGGVVLALVLAAGTAWAVSSGSDSGKSEAEGKPSAGAGVDPQASAGPDVSAGPDAAQAPQPGVSSGGASAAADPGTSVSASAVPGASAGGRPVRPAGWKLYKDKTGFSVYVPEGWKKSQKGTIVYFRGDNKILGIDQTDTPKSNPVKDWETQADYRVSRGDFPGYKKIKIKSVAYFRKAADWEFTFNRDGTRRHTNNRGTVVADDKAYGFYWETNDDVWADSLDDLKLVFDSFQPAK
ncbi:serine/threonine-protein kinase [Actinoplanes derwentensis]|nr:serine/threonine-protein kinase [Actinoplanes derwentensis]